MSNRRARTTQEALAAGDIEALLALHRETFGSATMTADAAAAAPPAVPLTAPPAPAAPQVQTFTAEDIERARQQEKDKLYQRLEEERAAREALEQRMQAFDTDLETRRRAEQEAREAAERAAEEKRQAELSYAERLAETEGRFTSQLQSLQEQIAQRDAILERERQYNELMAYRSTLLAQHADDILPELTDLVQGNSREELDAAVSAMVQRSASILQQVAAATQQARTSSRGVGVTAPPVGPMDNNPGHESVSAADIAAMDMQTYAQNRARLLGAASQQTRDRGMFG